MMPPQPASKPPSVWKWFAGVFLFSIVAFEPMWTLNPTVKVETNDWFAKRNIGRKQGFSGIQTRGSVSPGHSPNLDTLKKYKTSYAA